MNILLYNIDRISFSLLGLIHFGMGGNLLARWIQNSISVARNDRARAPPPPALRWWWRADNGPEVTTSPPLSPLPPPQHHVPHTDHTHHTHIERERIQFGEPLSHWNCCVYASRFNGGEFLNKV